MSVPHQPQTSPQVTGLRRPPCLSLRYLLALHLKDLGVQNFPILGKNMWEKSLQKGDLSLSEITFEQNFLHLNSARKLLSNVSDLVSCFWLMMQAWSYRSFRQKHSGHPRKGAGCCLVLWVDLSPCRCLLPNDRIKANVNHVCQHQLIECFVCQSVLP